MDLAILLEEVLESFRRESRSGEFSPFPRAATRTPLPLPQPPCNTGQQGHKADDRRPAEAVKSVPQDDKVAALRAYRRARGFFAALAASDGVVIIDVDILCSFTWLKSCWQWCLNPGENQVLLMS